MIARLLNRIILCVINNMCILIVSPAGSVILIATMISTSFGSSENLICIAQGGPDNTFQWTLRGQVISNSSQLQLPSITGSDGGVYTCTVTNAAGSDSGTVTVTGNIDICVAILLHISTVYT